MTVVQPAQSYLIKSLQRWWKDWRIHPQYSAVPKGRVWPKERTLFPLLFIRKSVSGFWKKATNLVFCALFPYTDLEPHVPFHQHNACLSRSHELGGWRSWHTVCALKNGHYWQPSANLQEIVSPVQAVTLEIQDMAKLGLLGRQYISESTWLAKCDFKKPVFDAKVIWNWYINMIYSIWFYFVYSGAR